MLKCAVNAPKTAYLGMFARGFTGIHGIRGDSRGFAGILESSPGYLRACTALARPLSP
ncbi:Uncharacterised protein [Mycobacteroides abscessus subsp. abscessus]|nr:Uncharacterised protein [Mycobacteroides abscessus subsp. abscessus]